MAARAVRVERVFHALGDPTRRAIVKQLSHGPASVSRLAAPLGITVAGIVQQLEILQASGLVSSEKTGRVRTCHIEVDGLALAGEWLNDCRSAWQRRLDRLGDFLAESED